MNEPGGRTPKPSTVPTVVAEGLWPRRNKCMRDSYARVQFLHADVQLRVDRLLATLLALSVISASFDSVHAQGTAGTVLAVNTTRPDGGYFDSFLSPLRFSADGRFVAVGCGSIAGPIPFRAAVWAVDGSDRRLYESPDQSSWPIGLDLSPSGQYVAAVDSALRLWDRGTGASRVLAATAGQLQLQGPVVFSPDSQLIAVVVSNSSYQSFAVLRVDTLAAVSLGPNYIDVLVTGLSYPDSRRIAPLAFSGDGSLLYVAADTSTGTNIKTWSMPSGSVVASYSVWAHVLLVSPQGGWLVWREATWAQMGLVSLADGATLRTLFFYTLSISTIAASQDGRVLAVLHGGYGTGSARAYGSEPMIIHGISTETGAELWNVTGLLNVNDIALSPDGSQLAYTTSNSAAHELKLVVRTVGPSRPSPTPSPTLIAAPSFVALQTPDKAFEVQYNSTAPNGQTFSMEIKRLHFSSDSRYVVSGFGTTAGPTVPAPFRAAVWAVDGSDQRLYQAPCSDCSYQLGDVDVSPDGQYVLAGDSNSAIRLWRRDTMALVPVSFELGVDVSGPAPLFFSPNSQLFAGCVRNASSSGFAVWRLDGRLASAGIGASVKPYIPLAFSDDSSLLYLKEYASTASAVVVWSIASSSVVRTLSLPGYPIVVSATGGWVVWFNFTSITAGLSSLADGGFVRSVEAASYRASRDGRVLVVQSGTTSASGAYSPYFRGFSTETGAMLWNITGIPDGAGGVWDVSPDGSLLVCGGGASGSSRMKYYLYGVSAAASGSGSSGSTGTAGTPPGQYRRARSMCLTSAGVASLTQTCGAIGAL